MCDHWGVLQLIFVLSKTGDINSSSRMSVSRIRPDVGQYIQLCALDGPLCENCE